MPGKPKAKTMKRVLFIDRDGTLIREAPPSYQVDSFQKLEFYPGVFEHLGRIAREFDFELVMVTNQDGLGSPAFPEGNFWPVQQLVIRSLANEGIHFAAVHIDRTLPAEKAPTRKPGTGMLTRYIGNPEYDLANSLVIGDRITDIQLAKNLGCKGIWLNNEPGLGLKEIGGAEEALAGSIALQSTEWSRIYAYFKLGIRQVVHLRKTAETEIRVELNIDGWGNTEIRTGLGFFDHMLEQLGRHGGVNLSLDTRGDLHIDEHHTIEDTGIALGEAFGLALADKRGMERYGFALPMDDAEARVLLDFGGRGWVVWNCSFGREKIGDMPTEMVYHFFKSFADAAKCNLNVECHGDNEHHKVESIFKAFARAIRMAIRRDPFNPYLPSTKGIL
jgi:imidazoleglycerol-phosphate dehydratase/histidinol-phosphatase